MNEFILLLGKMISDNIDTKFFGGEVWAEFVETRGNRAQVVRLKGSLRMRRVSS